MDSKVSNPFNYENRKISPQKSFSSGVTGRLGNMKSTGAMQSGEVGIHRRPFSIPGGCVSPSKNQVTVANQYVGVMSASITITFPLSADNRETHCHKSSSGLSHEKANSDNPSHSFFNNCDTNNLNLNSKDPMKHHALNPEAKEFVPLHLRNPQADSKSFSMDLSNQFLKISDKASEYTNARDELLASLSLPDSNLKKPNNLKMSPTKVPSIDSTSNDIMFENNSFSPISSENKSTLYNNSYENLDYSSASMDISNEKNIIPNNLTKNQTVESTLNVLISCSADCDESSKPVQGPSSENEYSLPYQIKSSDNVNKSPANFSMNKDVMISNENNHLMLNKSGDSRKEEDANKNYEIKENICCSDINKMVGSTSGEDIEYEDELRFALSDEDKISDDNTEEEDDIESEEETISDNDDDSEEDEGDDSENDQENESEYETSDDESNNDKGDNEGEDEFVIYFSSDDLDNDNDRNSDTDESDEEEKTEEEEDSDYNCDLFSVEFSDNGLSFPVGGLVLSDILSSNNTASDCTGRNGHGTFDISDQDDSIVFDNVDGMSYSMCEEVAEANKRWNEGIESDCSNITPTRVQFCDDVKTFEIDDWCRKGPWEECARDRMRFQRRIEQVESTLSPILSSEHRLKILSRLAD